MRHFFKAIYLIDYKNIVPKTVIGLFIILILLIPFFTAECGDPVDAHHDRHLGGGGHGIHPRPAHRAIQPGTVGLHGPGRLYVRHPHGQMGLPFWPSFFLAGLVSGLIALLVGMVVLRVGGIYFSIITLALGEIVRIVAQQWEPVTRGSRGIIASAPPPIVLRWLERSISPQVWCPIFTSRFVWWPYRP